MAAGNPETAGAIAPPPLIFAIPLAVALYENTSKPLPFLPPRFASIAGALAILAALVLWVGAAIQFRRAHTTITPYRPTTAIIESWPFSFSRNPIYLAMALMYVGISLLFNALWPLLLLPLVLIVIQRGVIEREERYLDGKFGSDYVDYKSRVRRWV
jgi:protein-S-isoprenylcysteine O-methyltransferase Ste14